MKKGLFLVFEGNNGAGKTTIINGLIKKLNPSSYSENNESDFINIKNQKKISIWNVYKFPNRTTVLGKKIDDFLKNKIKLSSKEVELKFFAENRKEFQYEMEYILNQGYNILCDRYIYSSMAYTLTDQFINRLDNKEINILDNKDINFLSIDKILSYDRNFIKPDYVFLIKGDYLHLRNEKEELYHRNELFNKILLNNYILSIHKTTFRYAIINNKFGELDDTINYIINIINKLLYNKLNKIN
jgi:dTMP kinase